MRSAERTLAIVLLLASLIAVAVVTLTPTAGGERISFWCLKCGERPAVDLLLNIILFVPVGASLGLYGLRFPRAAVVALLCTCSVEALQFFVVPGRYASSRDIVSNFAGAVLGYLLGRHWRIFAAPTSVAARVLATAFALLWLGTQAFTAWAMGISPPPEPWWTQLAPSHDRYPAKFVGRILGSSIGPIQLDRSDQLPSDAVVVARERILAGTPFRLVATTTDSTRGAAPIEIVSAGPVYDVVWWLQDGNDGVFGVAVRGTLLGLRTPLVRIADAFPRMTGDTVALAGSYDHGWYELEAANRTGVRHRELRASPSWGWAFLLPFPLWSFGSNVFFATALYLAVVWCALGYWNARAIAASNVIVPVGRMIIWITIGLAVIPIVLALPIAHWSEWLATIVGAGAGWTIANASTQIWRGSRRGNG